ncbi:MAG: hypothetical protein ACJ79G_15545, partial [Myxococcales bacterium]
MSVDPPKQPELEGGAYNRTRHASPLGAKETGSYSPVDCDASLRVDMRNFFSIAALLALHTPVQDRTGASPKEQAVAYLGAGKADRARASARACAEAGDASCLVIEGRAAFGSGDF